MVFGFQLVVIVHAVSLLLVKLQTAAWVFPANTAMASIAPGIHRWLRFLNSLLVFMTVGWHFAVLFLFRRAKRCAKAFNIGGTDRG